MPNLTAEQITNMYLYGSMTRPADISSENVIRSSNSAHKL